MGIIALIATISTIIQNVGIITSAAASLWIAAPYVKVGAIKTYNGIKYIAIKAKDGTVHFVEYVKEKISKKKDIK